MCELKGGGEMSLENKIWYIYTQRKFLPNVNSVAM